MVSRETWCLWSELVLQIVRGAAILQRIIYKEVLRGCCCNARPSCEVWLSIVHSERIVGHHFAVIILTSGHVRFFE